MQTITWKEEYNLGDILIDTHHKIFFEMIKDLAAWHDNPEKDKEVVNVLRFLEGYIHMHFEAEEAFMSRIGYPAFDDHKSAHHEFIERVEGIKQDMHEDPTKVGFETLLETAQSWFFDHILEEDLKIRDFVS